MAESNHTCLSDAKVHMLYTPTHTSIRFVAHMALQTTDVGVMSHVLLTGWPIPV